MAVFVNDAADANPTPLDALVRSGDYFITLATRLDLIAHELTEKDPGAAMSLEKIIRDLDYLQRNYTIDRKTK